MKESKRKLQVRLQNKLIIKEKYRKQMGKQPLNNKLINKSQFDNDNSLYLHSKYNNLKHFLKSYSIYLRFHEVFILLLNFYKKQYFTVFLIIFSYSSHNFFDRRILSLSRLILCLKIFLMQITLQMNPEYVFRKILATKVLMV